MAQLDEHIKLDKLTIAMFLNAYHPTVQSGAIQSTKDFASALRAKGHEVYIFTTGKNHYADIGNDAQYIFRCPSIPVRQGFGPAMPEFFGMPLFGKRGNEILKRCDILHCHQPYPISDYGMKIATQRKIPFVFTNHTQYHQYAKAYFPFYNNFGKAYRKWADKWIVRTAKRFADRCDLVLVPGKEIADVVVKQYGYKSRVELCPNGIDYELFSKGDAEKVFKKYEYFNLRQKDILIYTGRLEKVKNLGDLLIAMSIISKKNPNAFLMLVGDGSRLATIKVPGKEGEKEKEEDIRLEDLARNLKISEKIIITGLVPHAEMADYCASDSMRPKIFGSTSRTEVDPLTSKEAMAAGCVPVTYDAPGFCDSIVNGKTGILTENTPEKLAEAVISLMSNKIQLSLLSKNAKNAAKAYSKETAVNNLLEFYKSAIETKKRESRKSTSCGGKWTLVKT